MESRLVGQVSQIMRFVWSFPEIQFVFLLYFVNHSFIITEENAIDGNLFLTISEDDDEWDDLELPSKDEQALKYCIDWNNFF